MQDPKLGSLGHQIASRLNAQSGADWAIKDQAYTWTPQPVPVMSEHPAHLASLPFGFRTCLWWYTCLLLILMLWHRQAIIDTKGDNLSSFAECRVRSWEVWDTKSPADWMPTHKPTELSRIKHKLEPISPSLRLVSMQPTCVYCRLAFGIISKRLQLTVLCQLQLTIALPWNNVKKICML